MNSMLLTASRAHARRLISNSRCSLKNNPKQCKNYSTNKSNQNNLPPPLDRQSISATKVITYAGITIGSVLSGYLLVNSLRGGRETSSPSVPSSNEEQKAKLIQDLPEEIEYLIIGGGSAAFAALRSIRANQPLSKVIVISEEDSYPYMKPPLSKELWFAEPELKKDLKFKQRNDKERSLYYAHDEFYFDLKQLKQSETGGVTVLKGHKAVKIDPYDQYLILNNGQTIKYGKCLIATGSKGLPSELEDASEQVKERILKFKTTEHFKIVDELVNQNKSFVLVGSEFLASELACAMSKRDHTSSEIIQVMESKGNLNTILPEYLSEWTSKCLQEEGIQQVTSTKIKSAEFKNNKVTLHLSNGEQLQTDYLIIDNGAEPNTDLGKTGNLEICPLTGGLLANAEMQVRTNLWVAGDVASFYDEKLGRRRCSHHDNALITGRLAGENMSGGRKIFWHQPIIWSDLGPKIGFEGVGIIDSSLPTIAVFTKPEKDESSTKEMSANSDQDKELIVQLPNKSDDFYRGVVFYIKEGIVVGVLMWNLFSKTNLARRIIAEHKTYEDLSELAKLFELHNSDFDIDEEPAKEPAS